MQNEKQLIQRDKLLENVFAETNEDFILPDYMPEVRRVLRLETRLLRGEKFVGGGKAEFDGTVLYTLFYTDNEEKLTAVPLESRYEYRVGLGADAGDLIYSDEALESVSLRPSGPRRVNVRAKIRAAVHEVKDEAASVPLSILAEEDCPCLWREEKVLRTVRLLSDGFEASAERMLESDGEEIRPLYASAEALVEHAQAKDGHVHCRGTVFIRALAEKGTEIHTLTARVPFEEELIASECLTGDAVTARGVCSRVELEVEEDGVRSLLHATAFCSLSAEARRNEDVSVLTDLYSTEKDLRLTYTPSHTESLRECFAGNFTVEADTAAREGEKCLLSSVSVRDSAVKAVGEKAILTGECRAELLCQSEGEGFYAEDLTFPFRIEIPLTAAANETDVTALSVTPLFTEVSVQGGQRNLSAEMAVSLYTLRPVTVTVPATLEGESERPKADGQSVTVYYPTDEDSLWSVGKRYGMRMEELKKQNGILLDEDTALDDTKTLDGMAWLFVSRL